MKNLGRLAIPALLLAALTLQATPVPFLDGAGITSISNSVDATGAAHSRITGDVDLTPGRFLHIQGYSSVSLLIEWLVIGNASQPAPYLESFDWTWDGESAGRHPFALEYTIPAVASGVPEPSGFWTFLGGVLAYTSWKHWRGWLARRKVEAECARKRKQIEVLASMMEFHQHDRRG